ncbi:Crp/Fnr family transcriptional regulator [Listeria weihenstephanensis]|uniref:Crp/Fnr family transcriptional regulator n=1 Tax=Listeria weihenstephanensis TaxID=1006155 RepID=A0A841ZAE4_9LIST|nr:Crp/Fnr family transcriptional regulator [Listeria weihenstephanensis]MBC1501466.1 Crp/Fnr family transcriptional regulator [Listeria weihenstephanensis]
MDYRVLHANKNAINTQYLEKAILAGATTAFSLARLSHIDVNEGRKKNYMYIQEGTVSKFFSKSNGSIQFNMFYAFNDILGLIEPIDISINYFEYSAMSDVKGFLVDVKWTQDYIAQGNSDLILVNLQRESFWKDSVSKLITLRSTEKVYYILFLISEYRILNGLAKTLGLPKFVTHDVIARICGISREQVTRILSRLKKDGIVRVDDSGNLVILDSLFLKNALEIEEEEENELPNL